MYVLETNLMMFNFIFIVFHTYETKIRNAIHTKNNKTFQFITFFKPAIIFNHKYHRDKDILNISSPRQNIASVKCEVARQ